MRSHGASCDLERDVVGQAGAGERNSERHRSDELPLQRAGILGRDGEAKESPEALEVRQRQVGDDRCVDVHRARIDREAAVLAGRDPVDADDRLGDHALGGVLPGQRRDRGDVVLGEGESGGVPR